MAGKGRRLPSRVTFLQYELEIILVSQSYFQEFHDVDTDERLDGLFENLLGQGLSTKRGGVFAGRIYIDKALKAADRRAIYWHELTHALHDIIAFDTMSLVT